MRWHAKIFMVLDDIDIFLFFTGGVIDISLLREKRKDWVGCLGLLSLN